MCFVEGQILFAKLEGSPWWPSRFIKYFCLEDDAYVAEVEFLATNERKLILNESKLRQNTKENCRKAEKLSSAQRQKLLNSGKLQEFRLALAQARDNFEAEWEGEPQPSLTPTVNPRNNQVGVEEFLTIEMEELPGEVNTSLIENSISPVRIHRTTATQTSWPVSILDKRHLRILSANSSGFGCDSPKRGKKKPGPKLGSGRAPALSPVLGVWRCPICAQELLSRGNWHNHHKKCHGYEN